MESRASSVTVETERQTRAIATVFGTAFSRENIKKEVARLVELGVLRKNPTAKYSSPSFIIPKKDNTVRFVSDFRKINAMLDRAPFPTPKIKDLLQSLAGFQWVSAIDLNILGTTT